MGVNSGKNVNGKPFFEKYLYFFPDGMLNVEFTIKPAESPCCAGGGVNCPHIRKASLFSQNAYSSTAPVLAEVTRRA